MEFWHSRMRNQNPETPDKRDAAKFIALAVKPTKLQLHGVSVKSNRNKAFQHFALKEKREEAPAGISRSPVTNASNCMTPLFLDHLNNSLSELCCKANRLLSREVDREFAL